MRIALLTLVFTISVTITAQARLGENADELVARYGQPLKENDQKGEGDKVASADVIFQRGGFQVNVTLVDGLSVAESFRKISGDLLSIGEVRTLLTDNAQGHGWEAPLAMEGDKIWTRDDNAKAILNRDGAVLTIKSRDLINAQVMAKKVEHAPTLDGF
jgi:hypothetical protein